MWMFGTVHVERGLDPVPRRLAFLNFLVKAIEEGKILFPAMAHDQGCDTATFFNLFQRQSHVRSNRVFNSPSLGSRP